MDAHVFTNGDVESWTRVHKNFINESTQYSLSLDFESVAWRKAEHNTFYPSFSQKKVGRLFCYPHYITPRPIREKQNGSMALSFCELCSSSCESKIVYSKEWRNNFSCVCTWSFSKFYEIWEYSIAHINEGFLCLCLSSPYNTIISHFL